MWTRTSLHFKLTGREVCAELTQRIRAYANITESKICAHTHKHTRMRIACIPLSVRAYHYYHVIMPVMDKSAECEHTNNHHIITSDDRVASALTHTCEDKKNSAWNRMINPTAGCSQLSLNLLPNCLSHCLFIKHTSLSACSCQPDPRSRQPTPKTKSRPGVYHHYERKRALQLLSLFVVLANHCL